MSNARKPRVKARRFHPRAIIFDMDGVLVDSMPYHFIAWYESLRPFGVRVSCFDVYTKEGERWDKTLSSLFARAGIKPTRSLLERVSRKRRKIFKAHFKRFIFQGAQELVAKLSVDGYMLGLVSGTPKEAIEKILPAALRRYFDVIVAGNEVKKGKPHPEPYLKASAILGVRPQQCLVIENAPYGITAAKRAGMRCIAVATSLPAEYLASADMVVNELSEISPLLL